MKLLIQDIPFRPQPAEVAAFQGLAVSDMADALRDSADCSTGVLRLWSKPSTRLLGTAFTVQLPDGDHLVLQKAIDLARPGDVLVVQAGGDAGLAAVVGEIMTRWAMARGLAGFVIDGCIRDVDFISGQEWPVYARALNPKGPNRVGPGVMNELVMVGGMTVDPGDIVCGDLDGLVCIPRQRVREVPAIVQALMLRQREQITKIDEGTLDRSWIDQALAAGQSKPSAS